MILLFFNKYFISFGTKNLTMRYTAKLFFLYAIIFFTSNTISSAQIFDKTRGKQLQKLLNMPVTVYTDNAGPYTDRLKAAFKDYWKISTYQFVNISGGLPSNTVEGSPVFMPAIVGMTVRGHDAGMNHPFYVFGEALSSGAVYGEGIVAAFPINAYHNEFDVKQDFMYANCMLRLPYIVYNLQDMLSYLKSNGNEKGYEKYIEEKSKRLATKTLLIPADITKEWDINPNATALFKDKISAGRKPMKPIMELLLDESSISFNGKYKVITTAEIIKLEQSADADKYAVFLPAIDQKKYLMVYDLKTKELLYYEYANMGMRIKEKDFEKMNKAAGL